MKISDRKKGNICIIEISGELKLGSGVERYPDRFDELLEQGERQFVVDMVKVPWMDTSGINASLSCRKHLLDRDKEGEIKIALRGRNHTTFVFYELHKVFDLYEDVEAALAAFAVKV